MATVVKFTYIIENKYQPNQNVIDKLVNVEETGIINEPQITPQIDSQYTTFSESDATEIDSTHIEAFITLDMTSEFLSLFDSDPAKDSMFNKTFKSYIEQSLPSFGIKEEITYI